MKEDYFVDCFNKVSKYCLSVYGLEVLAITRFMYGTIWRKLILTMGCFIWFTNEMYCDSLIKYEYT